MKKNNDKVPIYEKAPVPKKHKADTNCTFKPNLNKTLKKWYQFYILFHFMSPYHNVTIQFFLIIAWPSRWAFRSTRQGGGESHACRSPSLQCFCYLIPPRLAKLLQLTSGLPSYSFLLCNAFTRIHTLALSFCHSFEPSILKKIQKDRCSTNEVFQWYQILRSSYWFQKVWLLPFECTSVWFLLQILRCIRLGDCHRSWVYNFGTKCGLCWPKYDHLQLVQNKPCEYDCQAEQSSWLFCPLEV